MLMIQYTCTQENTKKKNEIRPRQKTSLSYNVLPFLFDLLPVKCIEHKTVCADL